MSHAITYLFVPGTRPERFDKALAAGAGAIILDLEDAVAPTEKAAARRAVADWFRLHRDAADRIVVRINDVQSEWFGDDLAAIRDAGIGQVMLPKVEWREQVDQLMSALGGRAKVFPLVESARGIGNVCEIALAGGVSRLAFGTLDYAVDLDLSGDEGGLAYPSARIAIASRCADLPSPIAGVTPSIDDEARIRADFAFARTFGFGAKLCIHPKQVAVVHDAARPTTAEREWARRVMDVAQSSDGAVRLDGKMVDRPVILKARAILTRDAANNVL